MYNIIIFFKQKTAYDMRISDWSSDVCSSDLFGRAATARRDRASVAAPRAAVVARRSHFGARRRIRKARQGCPRNAADRQHDHRYRAPARTEERRVGKEWVSTGSSWWSSVPSTTQTIYSYENAEWTEEED